MLKELEGYDWQEAFAYAGDPSASNGGPDMRLAFPGCKVDLSTFEREDVDRIIGLVEGENDGPPWRCAGQLKDGRWFYLEAGCDYTGWDCQASGSTTMADTRANCERFAMTDEARELFGIKLEAM